MKRYLLLPLFVCGMAALFAQNPVKPSPAHRYLKHIMEEKIKIPLETLNALVADPSLLQSKVWVDEHLNTKTHNREADILVSGNPAPESEVHAAINPVDSMNIIASAINQDENNPTSPIDVPLFYSTDFGKSWKTSKITFLPGGGLLTLPVGGGDPVLSFEKNGKAQFTWLAASINLLDTSINFTIYAASSTNKGATWSAPVRVDGGKLSIGVLTGQGPFTPGGLVDKQWMATDQSASANEGRTYIVYTRFDYLDTQTVAANILLKSKPKTNNTWSAAVKVNTGIYDIVQFSSIDVDNKGIVHVLFFGGKADETPVLYYTSSADGGKTFSPEVKVSEFFLNGLTNEEMPDVISGIAEDRIYPCPHIAVSPTNDATLYATWSSPGLNSQETEGYDVWFTSSTDGGKTWAAPKTVNAGLNPLAEQFYPAITVNSKGTIILCYYDRTDDPTGDETHHVVAFSYDKGKTFTPARKVSAASSDFSLIGSVNAEFGIGEYTGVVATAFNAIPFWADGRSNDGDIDIYAAIVPIGGSVGTTEAGTITDKFNVIVPNPATGSLNVSVNLKEASALSVEMLSADGRSVWLKQLPDKQPVGTQSWDVPLAKGVYFCRVNTDFGWKVRKVMVE